MNLISFIKQHRLAATFIIITLVLVFFVIASRLKDQNSNQTGAQIPAVSLVPVADYRQQATIDLDSGTVQSLGQADLKAQMSAPIASVNVKLGDPVSAGQILVQLQNNDIKSQLEQALAQLDALKKGSRPEDIQISRTAAQEAQVALVNSIKDAYAKSDDAIHNHIDKFFANPRSENAQFIISVNSGASQITFQGSDPVLATSISRQKYDLESMLDRWQAQLQNFSAASSTGDVENNLILSEQNLQKEIAFFNAMAPLVNNLSTDNPTYKQIIDGYKAEFSAVRSTISGSLAALQGAQTGWRTANEALALKLAGATAEQLRQAQAAVDGLQATLAKTSIVAPISGKLSYIDATVGELAVPGQLIASVVNPGSLQIKTFASESDLANISVGDKVAIDGNASGMVQAVSPAIDPQTKKAEIVIIVTKNGDPAIVIGQSVSVKIMNKQTAAAQIYLLPIQAVQFSPTGNSVLTIGADNVVAQIPVTTGELIGESVQVLSGLAADMKIVSSVRGLKAGDKVTIQ